MKVSCTSPTTRLVEFFNTSSAEDGESAIFAVTSASSCKLEKVIDGIADDESAVCRDFRSASDMGLSVTFSPCLHLIMT